MFSAENDNKKHFNSFPLLKVKEGKKDNKKRLKNNKNVED